MKEHYRKKEALVGFVFIAAIALTLFATVVIGDLALFRPTETWKVQLDELSGLTRGDEVRVRGYQMGTVHNIRFDREEHTFRLTLRMDIDTPIYEDYRIQVADRSALGDRVLSIEPGTPTRPADKENLVGSPEPAGVMNQIEGAIAKLQDPIEQIREGRGDIGRLIYEDHVYRNLQETTAALKVITERLEKGEGAVGKILTEETVYDDLEEMVATLKRTVSRLEDQQGTLGKLLTDDTLHRDLAELLRRFREGEGALAMLLHEDSSDIVDEIRATATHFRSIAQKVDEGTGTVGMLVNDDALYRNVNITLADARNAVQGIQDGKGTLGLLLTDEKLYHSASEAAENLRIAATKAHTGDGTLPLLLNDPKIHDQIQRLLGRAIASVENARDSAPISAITSFLTGPF